MRDREFENEFLNAAAREAAISGQALEAFKSRVWKRLDKDGPAEYGGDDAYATRPPGELVSETMEESEDIAAWSLLTVQRLYDYERDGEIDQEIAHLIRLNLLSSVAASLKAHGFLTNAKGLLKEYSRKPARTSGD